MLRTGGVAVTEKKKGPPSVVVYRLILYIMDYSPPPPIVVVRTYTHHPRVRSLVTLLALSCAVNHEALKVAWSEMMWEVLFCISDVGQQQLNNNNSKTNKKKGKIIEVNYLIID